MSMTLEQVRDQIHAFATAKDRNGKAANYYVEMNVLIMDEWWKAIDAHLVQPAQSVDVRDVVLKSLGGYLERHWPDNPVSYDDMANKLTAALQEKGNG